MRWNQLLNSIFPQFCLHCNKKSNHNPYFLCDICLKNLEFHRLNSNVLTTQDELSIYSLWHYQKELKSIFSQAKFHDSKKILPLLFSKLNEFISRIDFSKTVLIKIPSDYNLVNDLALTFIKKTKCIIKEPFIKKSKKNTKLFNRDQRLSHNNILNIEKSMEIPKSHDVLLIDDLITSGSTLLRAKNLIEKNYTVKSISAFTIAFSNKLI
jgi:competence protein ComFC